MSWNMNENERERQLSEELAISESEEAVSRAPLFKTGKVNIDPHGIFQRTDVDPATKRFYILSIAAWRLFQGL